MSDYCTASVCVHSARARGPQVVCTTIAGTITVRRRLCAAVLRQRDYSTAVLSDLSWRTVTPGSPADVLRRKHTYRSARIGRILTVRYGIPC